MGSPECGEVVVGDRRCLELLGPVEEVLHLDGSAYEVVRARFDPFKLRFFVIWESYLVRDGGVLVKARLVIIRRFPAAWRLLLLLLLSRCTW